MKQMKEKKERERTSSFTFTDPVFSSALNTTTHQNKILKQLQLHTTAPTTLSLYP
jgi:hypothetical protein